MGILDTFYILFKTDAKKTATEVAGVGVAGDEAAAGLTAADLAAKRLGTSFMGMAAAFIAPLVALASVGSLSQIALDRAKDIRELDQAATKLNSAVGDVDAFSRSIRGAGGETTGAIDSLTKLGEKLNEAFSDKKSGARKDFKEWGVAFKNTKGQALGAVEGMLALAKSLEGVSRADALARIKKLGIQDNATIELLLKGKHAVQEKMDAEKKAGVVTEKQVQIAREYQGELGQTQNMLTSLGNSIMETLLPAFTAGTRAFRMALGWLIDNKTLVEGFFIGVAAVVTSYFLPAMYRAALATIAATWPFLAIGAAIAAVGAAFALAYEDVVAFMDGQPSLIGELVKRYEWVAEIVKGIGTAWRVTKEAVVASIDALKVAWQVFSDAMVAAWNGAIKPALDALAAGASTVLNAFVDFFHSMDPLWAAFGNAAQLAADVFKMVFGKLTARLNEIVTEWTPIFNAAKEAAVIAFNAMWDVAAPIFDKIVAAAGIIKDAFVSAFAFIKSAWDSTIGALAEGINNFVKKSRELLGLGDAAEDAQPKTFREKMIEGGRQSNNVEDLRSQSKLLPTIKEAMKEGKEKLDNAARSPIASQTSSSIRAAANTNEKTEIKNDNRATIGSVTVNIKEADGKQVAAVVGAELKKVVSQTQAHFDDGVAN